MAERHGAVRVLTTGSNYTGITADIVLPKTVSLVNGYADWYLGIGNAVIESGISKTTSGYKVFLGATYNAVSTYYHSEYNTSINDGQTVNLKLIYDHSTHKASLYVNGAVLPYTNNVLIGDAYKALSTYNPVKMVHGVQDQGGSSYSQASFSHVQLRTNTTGTTYANWDGSIASSITRVDISGNGGADQFTVYSGVPLSTSLKAK